MGSYLQCTINTSSYTIKNDTSKDKCPIKKVINDCKHTMEDQGHSDSILKHAFKWQYREKDTKYTYEQLIWDEKMTTHSSMIINNNDWTIIMGAVRAN